MDFAVLEHITSAILPMQPLALKELPVNLVAADPDMENGGEVDVLLGSEFFFEFLDLDGGRQQIIKDNDGSPLFLNTVFGWIVTGTKKQITGDAVTFCSQASLEKQIERFWSCEEIHTASKLTQEERDCEQHFQQFHYREKGGRYVVQLPFKMGGLQMIGDSKQSALSRFSQLERRFKRDESLRNEYAKVIREYISLGFLAKVQDRNVDCSFYLPHHPVIKMFSTSTKVRPVFDGSAKSTSGISLNDCLMVGPVVQDALFDLILRFRVNSVALVADIEKMYLQVKVHQEHTPYQRILWRFSEEEPIEVYELQRVTFGLGPSSFLATRVLQQLAEDEGELLPLGKRALLEDFYVDDFLGGASDENQASLLVQELRLLLQKGGFVLKKMDFESATCPDEKAVLDSIDLGAEDQFDPLGIIGPIIV
uniref:Peptidase aspartic putative domain-containing protein n=1 Tax=Anopheles minimus TaxID=112268 RepID=A0A182VT94_9DIPT